MSGDGDQRKHPWRDNIEAITMAIIMAVMLKYFIVEAYKIPTGSMQPTLMGNTETQVFDRILVDKFSFHYRDPERFEVVVFKYPLDVSKNFIKRIVGVGPEQLKVANGDLWRRADESEPWRVLRRPRPVQESAWKELHPGEPGSRTWKVLAGAPGWKASKDTITARGSGSVRFPQSGLITDQYRDGYPLSIRDKIVRRVGSSAHMVGDLRVRGEVEALEGCEAVTVQLREGDRRYRFRLPGPAAPEDERPSIRFERSAALGAAPDGVVELAEDWRLPAGRSVAFTAQNLDDRLTLELEGRVVLELDVPPATDQSSFLFLHVEGEGADFSDVAIARDIFYISDSRRVSRWDIPADHYVMLGDNTQDSSDSREWAWRAYDLPGVGIVRGNLRLNEENPHTVKGLPGGPQVWFRDEWGERHHWNQGEARQLEDEQAPFVPRKLITGRAVVVFWPFKWSLGLWRLRWIR
ncbi:MAG: signal peptidase I [Planctomycetota bacterium]|jgi:signal peptidase I|nr:signal peptidase I [Planctomycetota bacterium]MDP6763014.1 signal peptidase I [Planctomycetota bacterium]MDP6990681.1 signal peptidase I [Planctomycetota bacterium]